MEENPGEYYYPVQTKKSARIYENRNKKQKIITRLCFAGEQVYLDIWI